MVGGTPSPLIPSLEEVLLVALLLSYALFSSHVPLEFTSWLCLYLAVVGAALVVGIIILRDRVLVYMLLPSQIIASMRAPHHDRAREAFRERFGSTVWRECRFPTEDGYDLDAGEFRNPNLPPESPQRWVVWLNANGVCLEVPTPALSSSLLTRGGSGAALPCLTVFFPDGLPADLPPSLPPSLPSRRISTSPPTTPSLPAATSSFSTTGEWVAQVANPEPATISSGTALAPSSTYENKASRRNTFSSMATPWGGEPLRSSVPRRLQQGGGQDPSCTTGALPPSLPSSQPWREEVSARS